MARSSSSALVQSGATAAPTGAQRLQPLDGLRGLAAVAVLLHHTAYLSPTFSTAYSSPSTRPEVGSALWWVTSTPLRLATAGPEAVMLFFVLSGLVLVLPVLRRESFDWFAYYPQRLVRLLVPVTAAVLLATLIVLVSDQQPRPGSTAWLDRVANPRVDVSLLVRNLDLLAGTTQLDNPLWSLRWEVLFSVMLPVFVVLGLLSRRRWWLTALITAAILVVGAACFAPSFVYLPVFFAGVLLAVRLDRIEAAALRLNARRDRHLWWAIVAVLSAGLFICDRMVGPLMPGTPWTHAVCGALATTTGAVGFVLLALYWRPAAALTLSRPVAWSGRLSFSLYLVHVPILIGASYVAGDWHLGAAVGLPLSVVVAIGFSKWIEQPAHRLSKRVGAATAHLGAGVGAGTPR